MLESEAGVHLSSQKNINVWGGWIQALARELGCEGSSCVPLHHEEVVQDFCRFVFAACPEYCHCQSNTCTLKRVLQRG